MSHNTTYDRIIRILKENQLPFIIHKHKQVLTMQDVENNLQFSTDKLLKTLVFIIPDSFWILAVVRGQDRVDYRKLAGVFGRNRRYLKRPTAEEVEEKLGFQIGGISPIPTDSQIQVVFDKSIMDMDIVYCGVGRNDRSLEIRLHHLLRVSHATFHSIAETLE